MAAILRSGKFLRIVSNLARSTQGGQQQQQGQQTQQCPATFPTQDAQPYHAWSLQHLQNALPILSTDQDKAEVKRQDEEQHQKLQKTSTIYRNTDISNVQGVLLTISPMGGFGPTSQSGGEPNL